MKNVVKRYIKLIKKKLARTSPSIFTNILYLALEPSFAFEYINSMRKQYPNYDFRVMIPLIENPQDSSDIVLAKFNFFSQNRNMEAVVYKLALNNDNIQMYGIYLPLFSKCKDISEIVKLPYLSAFLKSVRISIKKLEIDKFLPNIIHSENIPFFLGSEFDKSFSHNIKVVQILKDVTRVDMSKSEAFWAALNIADADAMKKICRDKVVKNYVAALFKLHNDNRFCKMRECLNFIYKNYSKFRKYIDKGDDVEENIVFNKLNARIIEMFPQLNYGDNQSFNLYMSTIERVDLWAVISQTYYEEIFQEPQLSGNLYHLLVKTKEKSSYISYGFSSNQFGYSVPKEVYETFDVDNFREFRVKNKIAILKEFSADRIKTNFVDSSLFIGEYSIVGFLDTFYESPLLFVHTNCDVFANGIDIMFNVILKLFELHKNVQVIICIKDGLKNNFIRSWIEFFKEKEFLNGKWVFIDGDINLSKFYSASDMTLIPRRSNMNSLEHFIAMHYGCVPIVSRNGILNDTISDIFDDMINGCGFKTKTGLLTDEDNNKIFLSPVLKALSIYQQNPSSWNLLIKNCLLYDSKWHFSIIEKYNEIYKKLL